MQARAFKQWLRRLDRLSRGQRSTLLQILAPQVQREQVADIIEMARARQLRCPECHGVHHVRHGHANGLQRYRCRGCRRTFNALTGTPLARLRKKFLWLDFCT
ncbi:MAG: IS1595 family transposase, partial [Gammaproteobacteria bacterium]